MAISHRTIGRCASFSRFTPPQSLPTRSCQNSGGNAPLLVLKSFAFDCGTVYGPKWASRLPTRHGSTLTPGERTPSHGRVVVDRWTFTIDWQSMIGKSCDNCYYNESLYDAPVINLNDCNEYVVLIIGMTNGLKRYKLLSIILIKYTGNHQRTHRS